MLPTGRVLVGPEDGAEDGAEARLYDRHGRLLGRLAQAVRPGVAPLVVDASPGRIVGAALDGDGAGTIAAVALADARPSWSAGVDTLRDLALADRALYVLEDAGGSPEVRALALSDGRPLFTLEGAAVADALGLAAAGGQLLVYGAGVVTAYG